MPKKTKKEKLLAQAHRLPSLRRQTSVSQIHSPSLSPIATAQLTYAIPSSLSTAPKSRTEQIEYTAIKHDLIKTIIWSACIILGELLLSRYLK